MLRVEQVMAMEKQEILSRAARIFGAVETKTTGAGKIKARYPEDEKFVVVPDFFRDIAEAEHLMDKVLELGYTVDIFSAGTEHHECLIGCAEEEGHQVYTSGIICKTRGESVARAFVAYLSDDEE